MVTDEDTTRQRKSRLGEAQQAAGQSANKVLRVLGADTAGAVASGAWAYPIVGIVYFLSHPSLVKPVLPTLVKGVVASVAITLALFVFTYLPQTGVLFFIAGPLAPIACIPLIFGEAYFLINLFLKSFVSGQVAVDMFDTVLIQKGHASLVERGRRVTKRGKTAQLGRIVSQPLQRFNTSNLIRYVLTLPLNLIPVVGTVFFLGYNGYKAGPGYHSRYFELKAFDKDHRHAAIRDRRSAYTAFGIVATTLNLIPVVSVLFQITSSIGGALWAHDIENQSGFNPVQALWSGSAGKTDPQDVEVTANPAEN